MNKSQKLTAEVQVMMKTVTSKEPGPSGQANRTGIGGRFWGWIWLACWLTVAGAFFASWLNSSGSPLPPAVASQAIPAAAPAPSVPIEKLKVGDRVVAAASAAEMAGETEVDPATWRRLRLEAEAPLPDGRVKIVRVDTLQPSAWVATHNATVGSQVPLPLDLLEMGLSPTLQAKVVANEACPDIESGPGRVVLSTIENHSDDLYELTVTSLDGQVESIGATGLHKFYRPSDDQWVAAHDLQTGDLLQGAGGQLVLHGIEKLPGDQPVFNLTVEGEHVYRVSHLGALVHNNCSPDGLRLYQLDTSGVAPTTNVGRWSRTEFQGRRVFQRNDLFDPARRSSWVDPDSGQWVSGTNVERMRSGLAPVGTDGRPLQLHHLTGEEVHGFVGGTRGPVAEVTATFHQQNTATLHIPNARPNPNYVRGGSHPRSIPQYPSFRRDNLGNLTQEAADFDAYRSAYWQNRASGF